MEYACVAVVELGLNFGQGQPVPLRQLAHAHEIPAQFLAQILQSLKAAGLVLSARGPAGGYQLSRPPDSISLWDIVLAVEGDTLVPGQSGSFTRMGGIVAEVWHQAALAQRAVLSQATIAQLCDAVTSTREPMYYI
jgi:Rrf2 family protein